MFWAGRRVTAARDLVYRYPFLVDERRSGAIAQIWTDDATLVLPDQNRIVGRSAIRDYYLGLWGALVDTPPTPEHPGLRHHVTNLHTRACGRQIHARSYFVALSRRGVDHWGICDDEIIVTRDTARFRKRAIGLAGAVPDSVLAQLRSPGRS